MPSATLQSRINMFEHGPTTSPPSKQHILETPISPKAAKMPSITPSLSSSPEIITKGSLLEDWVIDDGSPPRSRTISPTLAPTAPLISFQSPPRNRGTKPPPLPPRKPSYNSLRSVSSSSSGSQSLQPPRRTDSLTVDYSYPPDERNGHSGPKKGHMPASSISSFHSVSLSSDGDPLTPGSVSGFKIEHHDTGASTNESFEEVSASSIVSPSTAALLATQIDPRRPPKLPRRPSERASPPSSPPSLDSLQSSTNSIVTIRRPPPPRPNTTSPRSSYTSSDRSSVLSTTTSVTSRSSVGSAKKSTQFSSQQAIFPIKRPTPIPPAARARFEPVFEQNVRQRRRAEQQRMSEALDEKKKGLKAGWRGLSVDLITNPPPAVEANAKSPDPLAEIGPEVRLEAYIVRAIWSRSKLNKAKLRAIWDECDQKRLGSLDREGFVRGMWRIDEELGRMQLKNAKGPIKGRPIPARDTSLLLH